MVSNRQNTAKPTYKTPVLKQGKQVTRPFFRRNGRQTLGSQTWLLEPWVTRILPAVRHVLLDSVAFLHELNAFQIISSLLIRCLVSAFKGQCRLTKSPQLEGLRRRATSQEVKPGQNMLACSTRSHAREPVQNGPAANAAEHSSPKGLLYASCKLLRT